MTDAGRILRILLLTLLAVGLLHFPARGETVQGEIPCFARADVESLLAEGGYKTVATGIDARGNTLTWCSARSGAWVILIAPQGQAGILCVAAAGGMPARGGI